MDDNVLVVDADGGFDLIQRLDGYPEIAIDCETTGLDHNRSDLHGIGIAVDDGEWYVTGTALEAMFPSLVQMSGDPNISWLMWNSPFDMHFLLKSSGFYPKNLIDVQVAAHMVDENQSMKLKEQARMRLGLVENLPEFRDLQRLIKKEKGFKKLDDITVNDIPLDILAPYGAKDPRYTMDLWKVLKPDLQSQGLYKRFINKEMPFMKVLEKMERGGFCVDQERLTELEAELTEKFNDLYEQWRSLTGEVNPNSPKQLGEYIYGVLGFKPTSFTKTGQPSTDALTLKRFINRDKTGSIKTLLDLRSVQKNLTTYIVNFRKMMYEGAIYAGFNRTGTVTGRIASSDPNLQNIPIRTELGKRVRSVFIARLGCLLIDIDYSQVELRIAAHYSRDEGLLRIFMEGLDPHQIVADALNIPRWLAKTLNYCKFYGGGVFAVADQIENETGERPRIKDLREWMRGWDNTFPGVNEWSQEIISECRRYGYVTTIGGRRRRLPEINSYSDSIRAAAERQAPNAVIQGSAADLLQDAMIELPVLLDWYGAKFTVQVHDEVVIEAPEEVAPKLAPHVQKYMEDAGRRLGITVPIVAEPGIGPRWTEAKGS